VESDGRAFDHRTLRTIRPMAVGRVREGEAPTATIAASGVCRTAIRARLRAVAQDRACAAGKRPPAP
jgi:hypothetical protein